ncbi:MAG TPA: 3'(2'),5'-bisphosphate nucleotidase CysQ [Stellaceae bacterium]|nr:3'(2'),5'-bisphosphate nucleotidase CysQ [Stellaceae bacterium]
MKEWSVLVAPLARAARQAGKAILEIYAEPFEVRAKTDSSPVTRADEVAETILLAALTDLTPEIPVVAEEQVAARGAPAAAAHRFWLVDPLDGTKEFIARNGEFTVNIALVEGGRVILGIVHVPILDMTYTGAGLGTATRCLAAEPPLPITARLTPSIAPIVTHSRSHADETRLAAYLQGLANAKRLVSGSSVKFCLLASGEADLYPRFGPTMEWDTGAGQAVLEAAGGCVLTSDGVALDYGKPGFRNPEFIAYGKRA